MRKTLSCLITALLLLATSVHVSAEVIGFTGPYAPNTWTATFLGNLSGISVPGSTVNTTTSLVITGGDSSGGCIGGVLGSIGPCEIRFTTGHIENSFSFHWVYSTSDTSGPAGDLFGVIVNGVRTVLSDAGGANSQSGDFLVSALTSFGWFINCTDCLRGAATATVTDFRAGVAQIPEPEAYALLLAGLSFFGFCARRKKAFEKSLPERFS